MMPPKPWTVTSSSIVKSFRIFNLRTDQAVSPRTGLTHEFYILETPTWVNVIPLTAGQEVVLVQQYRHGIREVTLEIPGGLTDQDTPAEAAERELWEETGFKCRELIPLGSVHANPAILNNRCFTYLAKDVYPAGSQKQDEREDISVVLKPLRDIPRLISEGVITHSLVIVAFYRLFMEYFARDYDLCPHHLKEGR